MEEFNSLANAVLKQEQAKMRLVADDALLEDKLVKSAQDLRRMKSLYIAEEINIKEMIYDLKHLNDNILIMNNNDCTSYKFAVEFRCSNAVALFERCRAV
tara:strand:+ start:90 stop:389 length:300 start_codon:yes stop_codon:yes gene_type:complete